MGPFLAAVIVLLKAIEQERRNREVEELREAVDLYNKGRDTWG
jgi:hypothetical protein